MNNSYPERKAFEFFYPKMKSGSVIIFDDYCFNQRISKPLGLPTGQGMLIKF